MNILINYLYEHYPFTTASYYEMVAKEYPEVCIFRSDNYDPKNIDLVLNVEPVGEIIKIPGVPSVYYEIDNHIIAGKDRHFYDQVDLVLLAQEVNREFYSEYNTEILPLGCWPKLHKRYPEEKEKYDIGFIGNDTYPRRRKLLEILDKNFKLLRTTSKPGEEYSRLLNQCKLTFNCSMQNDVNMRFFEAVASGRMLITDFMQEQLIFGNTGVHYDVYNNDAQLVDKVRFYLEHKDEREKIASAGINHFHFNHSYSNRLKQLLCLTKNLVS